MAVLPFAGGRLSLLFNRLYRWGMISEREVARMTLNQIMYFLAIVEQKSFSHAAEKMFISQSSLSKQIKAIENELGVILFSRDNYQIELTDAGKAFLAFATQFSKEYSDMLYVLAPFSNIHKAAFTVQVGTIPVLCYSSLINHLINLESRHQNIHIDFVEREQTELLKMLDRNQIDFIIVRIDYLSPDEYDSIPLAIEELGVVCSAKSHWASKKRVNLRDLENEAFILLNNTSSLYQLCIDACRRAGFIPRVNYTSSRHEALLAMVNTGLGLTLLPQSLLDMENSQKLRFIPLTDNVTSTIALVRKKEMRNNQKNNHFQNIVKEYFKEIHLGKRMEAMEVLE